MLKLFYKPSKLLFGVALITFCLAIVCGFYLGNSAIDIAVHDTYYVIAYYQMLGILALFYGLLGLIYWLFRKVRLILIFNLVHIFSSIFCPGAILYSVSQVYSNGTPRRYSSFTFIATNLYEMFNLWVALFSISQCILLLNILIGLIRKE